MVHKQHRGNNITNQNKNGNKIAEYGDSQLTDLPHLMLKRSSGFIIELLALPVCIREIKVLYPDITTFICTACF